MRGIGLTLSRLPFAQAVLAGAVILTGALSSAVHGQTSGSGNGTGTLPAAGTRADESALAVPHTLSRNATIVVVPRPISPRDAELTRQIFALQSRGDMTGAMQASAELDDPLLLGNLLADRYLGRFHRSSTQELTDWLARYDDLPEAPAIHALLLTKLPGNTARPATPEAATLPRPTWDEAALADPEPNQIDRDPVLDRGLIDQVAGGSAAAALRQVAARKRLSPGYAALLRAEIAQALFLANQNRPTLDLVQTVLANTPPSSQPALAFYVGGLAAWRLDRFDVARTLFEGGARSGTTSARLRAACAFWASRAARLADDTSATVGWLRTAAEQPLTFHGLLARRVLRTDAGLPPEAPLLSQADVDAVAATPAGLRAFALLQIGQPDRAEQELRGLWPLARRDPPFGRSLTLVAASVGLGDLAAQLADLLQVRAGIPPALPRLQVPRLRPAGGFRLDPPLIYALTRVESNFDAGAVSAAGARGLMQIMPETAQFVTRNALYEADRLHEPAANLAIGQRYLASLSGVDGIGDNLIRILASYNAGPGNVLRWMTGMQDQDDPLLFIEAIPVAETRAFVPKALTYAWVYAAQMHLPSPSLDALAAGEFPRFTAENRESKLADIKPSRN